MGNKLKNKSTKTKCSPLAKNQNSRTTCPSTGMMKAILKMMKCTISILMAVM